MDVIIDVSGIAYNFIEEDSPNKIILVGPNVYSYPEVSEPINARPNLPSEEPAAAGKGGAPATAPATAADEGKPADEGEPAEAGKGGAADEGEPVEAGKGEPADEGEPAEAGKEGAADEGEPVEAGKGELAEAGKGEPADEGEAEAGKGGAAPAPTAAEDEETVDLSNTSMFDLPDGILTGRARRNYRRSRSKKKSNKKLV